MLAMTCEVMASLLSLPQGTLMFGGELKRWRSDRRLSQEALADIANVSPRHASCLERGVAWPSEGMVLRLARALDLPLRERNALLSAAGFAARWRDSGDTPPEALLPAIDRLLNGVPWPAYALSGTYRLLEANQAGWTTLGALLPEAEPGLDLVRAFAGEGAHRTMIEDFDTVARAFLTRVRADAARQGPVSPLWAAVDDAEAALGPPPSRHALPRAEAVLPLTVRIGDITTRWNTVLLSFGTPLDAGVEDLTIKQLLPLDDETAAFAQAIGTALD